jgi:two-component system response regulator YesN
MYKVVLVDDEEDIRKRIISIFSQIESDFEIVADYENGIDAYEAISCNVPDLLITDIRIPYINGIELIEKVRRFAPLLRVIIISGYDEFDYAKQAIDLGVMGYITKPITKNDLSTLLEKVKNSIDAEYLLNKNISRLKDFHTENIKSIRENDLCRLVSMNDISENFKEKLATDGINLDYEYFMLGIFDYDTAPEKIEPENFEFGFLSIIDSLNSKICDDYDYEIFHRNDKLILFLKGNYLFRISEIEQYFRKILYKINRMINSSISLSFSNVSKGSHPYKKLYNNALKALEYRTMIGGNQILFFDNLQDAWHKFKSIDEDEYKRLTYHLSYSTLEEIFEHLERLIEQIRTKEFNTSYQYMLLNILHSMLKACDDIDELNKSYMDNNDLYLRLFNQKVLDEILEFFKELATKIKTVNDEYKNLKIENSLVAIVDYIEVHYKDFDLSLESLSEKVNLSVSYISALLKKGKKTTFVKYLTNLRMEKASELLKDKSLKIIDVAEAVGYNDPYYFSHCFKKYYGISPKEFRNNG